MIFLMRKDLLLKCLLLALLVLPINTSLAQGLFEETHDSSLETEFTSIDLKAGEALNMVYTDLSRKERIEIRQTVLAGSALTNRLNHSTRVIMSSRAGTYLNELKAKILKDYPSINELIKIYIADDVTLNAFATVDNHIYINVGLLARIQTEGQLAFILCHEIMHIVNQHIIKETIVVRQTVDKIEKDNLVNKDEILQLQHHTVSQRNEFESDLDGYKLFSKMDYNQSDAIDALELLKSAQVPIYEIPNDENYYFIDSMMFSSMQTNPSNESYSAYVQAQKTDSLTTHPSVDQRIIALSKIIIKDSSYTVKSPAIFEEVRTAARNRAPSIMAKQLDFISLFISASQRYHNGDQSDATINDLCYAAQGVYLDKIKEYNNKDRFSFSESEYLLSNFYSKAPLVDVLCWSSNVMNMIRNDENAQVVNKYLIPFQRNIKLVIYGPLDFNEILWRDSRLADTSNYKSRLRISNIDFSLSPHADFTKRMVKTFNHYEHDGYYSGKIALLNTTNVFVKKAKLFSYQYFVDPYKSEKMGYHATQAYGGLEDEYEETVVSLPPNSEEYSGQTYLQYKMLQNWMSEKFYFDSLDYCSYFEDEIKTDFLDNDVRYVFSNLNVSINTGGSLKSFFLTYFSPFIFPLYTPMLAVNTALDGTRSYMLSTVFDLQNKQLVFWERRTTIEPTTAAYLYGQYEQVINTFTGH